MVWTYDEFVRDALARVTGVACEALLASTRHDASESPLLLDVRESDEWGSGVIPGSVLLPRGLLEKHVFEHIPDRDASVCVYCSTGKRSAMAADTLARMGYRKVTHLIGGIEQWRQLGYPLMGDNQACQNLKGKLSWEDIRNEFAIVNRQVPILGTGSRNLVYLDHAASTHAPKTVLDAYVHFLETEYANVHRGTHLLSRRSTERFEEAYHTVADYLGAELTNGAVCFTQNTTEAIDLCGHIMAQRTGSVVTTELEHHSNELPHRTRGPVLRARVHDDGSLDLDHLETLLRHNDVKLVAVTAGSNVTGYMPDLGRIARMAHEAGALILVDGAQALARLPIRVKPIDDPEHIDFFASAGHKAYAPFGAGFLYGPRALMTEAPPYVAGGGTAAEVTASTATWLPSPERHHGGTPNIPGVVGMASSLRFLSEIGLENVREHEVKLTRRALDAFAGMEGITVYGPKRAEDRLGVLSFNVDGVEDLMTAAVLSEEGALAVRNGRFCSHIYCDRLLKAAHPEGSVKRPEGAVRASFGLYNNESDVDRLIEFVTRVRDRQWVGRYRIRGGELNAEFAGRCADRWMEPTAGAEAPERELVGGAASSTRAAESGPTGSEIRPQQQ
jgi:cysteine desulfurase / selenocysteine lyase